MITYHLSPKVVGSLEEGNTPTEEEGKYRYGERKVGREKGGSIKNGYSKREGDPPHPWQDIHNNLSGSG